MAQLLVSVRNVEEVLRAVQGGADIIDVKEPHGGSLGCASPEIIRDIAGAMSGPGLTKPPLSLALGELMEWRTDDRDELRSAIQTVAPDFLKLGLAHMQSPSAAASWIGEWLKVRNSISGPHAWVAVAYADHHAAGSPDVTSVLKAAIETGCQLLLIDTHTKNGKSLSDHVTLAELQSIRRQTSLHGIKLALAGGVTPDKLIQLLTIQPDIVAVRGAVCEQGFRTSRISTELVRQFCTMMHAQ